MDGAWPPPPVLRAAHLTVVPGALAVREGLAWLVRWRGSRGVLRCRPVAGLAPGPIDDVRWLHEFLARLGAFGFPAPRPLPAFAGQSWLLADSWLWELVSYLGGREVGWANAPPIEEIGGLLARYHAAAGSISAVGPISAAGRRPGVIPLADVPEVLLSAELAAACPDPAQAGVIRGLAERLASDLETSPAPRGAAIVIHGDFTNHNVIADGMPPRPVGVIDFERAHVEHPVADLGYGLWPSGRPYQEAAWLDLTRLRRLVAGYAAAAALAADDAGMLPLFLYGRGLQMIAKRVRAGRVGAGMLDQVRWTIAHAAAIADAAVGALPGSC